MFVCVCMCVKITHRKPHAFTQAALRNRDNPIFVEEKNMKFIGHESSFYLYSKPITAIGTSREGCATVTASSPL